MIRTGGGNMKHLLRRGSAVAIAASLSFSGVASAASDKEIQELKAEVRILMQRVNELEKERATPPPPPAPVQGTPVVVQPPAAPVVEGHASPVAERDSFNDQQQ